MLSSVPNASHTEFLFLGCGAAAAASRAPCCCGGGGGTGGVGARGGSGAWGTPLPLAEEEAFPLPLGNSSEAASGASLVCFWDCWERYGNE